MPLGTLGDGRRPHAVHECLPGYHINFSEKRNAKIKRQPKLDTITCFLRISDSTTTPLVTSVMLMRKEDRRETNSDETLRRLFQQNLTRVLLPRIFLSLASSASTAKIIL